MESTNVAEIVQMPPGQTGRARREAAQARRRTVIGLGASLAFLFFMRLIAIPLQRAYAHQQALVHLEQAMGADPFFRGVRGANPGEFGALWGGLAATVKKDVRPESARQTVRAYCDRVTDQRLRHTDSETLRRVVALRVETIQPLMAESPVACYEFLTTSDLLGNHADKAAMYREKLGALLAAPASSPIPRDDVRARKQGDALLGGLTAGELAALQYSNKPWTDQSDLCRAILKIYQAALALPDTDCALALRYLELLPADDRPQA